MRHILLEKPAKERAGAEGVMLLVHKNCIILSRSRWLVRWKKKDGEKNIPSSVKGMTTFCGKCKLKSSYSFRGAAVVVVRLWDVLKISKTGNAETDISGQMGACSVGEWFHAISC